MGRGNSLKATSIFVIFAALLATAESVRGVSVMRLSKPADAVIRQQALNQAADSLKTSLYVWLHQNAKNPPDLKNPIDVHFYRKLAAVCVKRAEQESYFEGHEWTLALTLKPDVLQAVVDTHNKQCKESVMDYWKLLQQGMDTHRPSVVLNAGIQAMFYAEGAFDGPVMIDPPAQPADTTAAATDSAQAQVQTPPAAGQINVGLAAKQAVQAQLNKLKVSYSSPIITGKPGNVSETNITITAMVDSTPLPGLVLTGRLPDGWKVFDLKTDAEGVAKIHRLKMPFVAYGTFLHIRPNLGAFVDSLYDFGAQAFDLKLGEGQDQTLMFNTVKPLYTLEYKAVSASQEQVPTDFASGLLVTNFLEDSCHLQPHVGDKPLDLSISIRCQVSSYSFDDREETRLKAEVQAAIKQMRPDGGEVERTQILHQRSYDSNHDVPRGLFFWETTGELRKLIKEMLAEL